VRPLAFLLALALGSVASAADPDAVDRGRVLFTQVWVPAAPHGAGGFGGLGPVFNDTSCIGCHVGTGRGGAPEGLDQHMRGMLVRLSLPGRDEQGGPLPVPAYGDQLNDHAIPGAAAEGRAVISWREMPVKLGDGTIISLRMPSLGFADLAYGTLGPEVLTSVRIAQPLAGTGLLENIPEADILANAKSEGRGHANLVWNPVVGEISLGRFGWKANQPTLAVQIAAAALGDMGLTSVIFPDKNCRPVQSSCLAALRGPQPDLDARRLADLTAYVAAMEAPARRNETDAKVTRGEAMFGALGCPGCHKTEWRADGQTIHPYTDLLLHDMGPGLADGRPDFRAGPSEWRTAPLWGIGQALDLNPQAAFLHDGRARSLIEAVLWHGGEAQAARDGVAALPATDREALLAFLDSL